MKIVHVIGSFDPAKGGPQAVVVRLAAAQASLGHDVTIVSYSDAEISQRSRVATRDIPDFDQVHTLLLAMPDLPEKLWASRSGAAMEALLRSADFIHMHGVWESILLKAARIATKAHRPYCIAPCGMLDSWSMQQKSWKKKIALWAGYKHMLDRASFIHALNEDEIQLMQPLGIHAPKRIIPNGVFLNEVSLPAEKPAHGSALPDTAYILFLSRLHYKKGLDILAEAFAAIALQFPHVDLVVAGPDGGAEAEFLQRIKTHGLAPRVHLVGGLYGADKIAAMQEALCFCLPSRQEGFSVAITEALACATPVVITDACHFPEVAAAGAGLITKVEAGSVADGLAKVLADRTAAAAMGKAGRKLVEQNYTWPVIAAKTIDIYQDFAFSSLARPEYSVA